MTHLQTCRLGVAKMLAALLALGALFAADSVHTRAWADEAAKQPPAEDLASANADLEKFKAALKDRKARDDEITEFMAAVGRHYVAIKAPDPVDDPKAQAKAESTHAKAVEGYRKAALKLIFKAYGKTKVKGSTNTKDEVNLKAAEVIGSLAKAHMGGEPGSAEAKAGLKAREDISKRLRKDVEKLKKIKHDLNTDVLDASFKALGAHNTKGNLQWMLDEYSHAKNNEVDWLRAAHKAMISFTGVPGKLRYAIVEQFIRTYAGVESSAETSSIDPNDQAKKRFWDDIKTFTIPVVQYYARAPGGEVPADAEGNALAKMSQFQTWFKEHKRPNRAPWVDPK